MKKFKVSIVFFLFELLLINTFYLYSLRSIHVFWGSSIRDGLFFVLFFVFILPAMLLISLIKVFFKLATLYRVSYFFYTLVIIIPLIDGGYSQENLLAGMIICGFIAAINLIEFYFIFKKL